MIPPSLPFWNYSYYSIGAIAAAIGLFGIIWAKLSGAKFVRLMKDKLKLIEERDRAVEAAEASRKFAEITSQATAELRGIITALDAHVNSLSNQINDVNDALQVIKRRFSLAIRYALQLNFHIHNLTELLNDHAPQVPVPAEPTMPDELRDDLIQLPRP